MRFSDIEQFMSWGGSTCDVEWNDLEEQLQRYLEHYNLDLDPDFQRAHVWTPDKQIAYVEYILKGGQYSKDIIFNCPGWIKGFEGPMVLVDGKQRLQAVRLFLNDKLPVFGGHYLKDFERGTRPTRRKIPMRYSFKFHINDLATRREILKFYLDLNSGGVVHTEEELARVRELLAKEL